MTFPIQKATTASAKRFVIFLLIVLAASSALSASPQAQPNLSAPKPSASPTEKAWFQLRSAAGDGNADRRAKALQALGLISKNKPAADLAVAGLQDEKTQCSRGGRRCSWQHEFDRTRRSAQKGSR